MVDWSTFGINLLTAIISSIVTLVIGWGIAWKLIHSYQRKNIEVEMRNKLIEEISSFRISLHETTNSLLRCGGNETNDELWYIARTKLLDISTKQQVMYTKILNQYPNFIYKKFDFKDEKGKFQEFTIKKIAKCFNDYANLFSDSLNKKDYDEDTLKKIVMEDNQILRFLSHVLLGIIKEPLSKVILKKVKENQKKRKFMKK